MSRITFDTHKLVKRLEAAGVTPQMAEALCDVLREALDTTLATKKDRQQSEAIRRRDIRETKFSLLKWIVGLSLAQLALLIGILLKLPH